MRRGTERRTLFRICERTRSNFIVSPRIEQNMRLRILLAVICALVSFGSDVLAGTLSGTFTALPSGSNVNLSVTGPADWVHWGRLTVDSVNRKASVVQQIDTFGVVGEDVPFQFTNIVGFSWSNGTPTAAITNTLTGVYITSVSNGFSLAATASTNQRTLKV